MYILGGKTRSFSRSNNWRTQEPKSQKWRIRKTTSSVMIHPKWSRNMERGLSSRAMFPTKSTNRTYSILELHLLVLQQFFSYHPHNLILSGHNFECNSFRSIWYYSAINSLMKVHFNFCLCEEVARKESILSVESQRVMFAFTRSLVSLCLMW